MDNKEKEIQKKLDEATKKATEYPPTWDFKKEAKIYGTVKEMKEMTLKGELTKMAIINKLGSEELFTVWLGTVLEKKFSEQEIKVGNMICVQFLGEVERAGANNYNNFAVGKL